MPADIRVDINERDGAEITISFTTPDGEAATPEWLKYSVTDSGGEVINGRNALDITPAQTVKVAVSGADLPNGTNRPVLVRCTFEGEIKSGTMTFGISRWIEFAVQPVPGHSSRRP